MADGVDPGTGGVDETSGVGEASIAEAFGVEVDAVFAVGPEPHPASTRRAATDNAAHAAFLMQV